MDNRETQLVKYAVEYLLDADLSSECWTEEDIKILESIKDGTYHVEVIKPNSNALK